MPTLAGIPVYELPVHRFLQGRGDLNLGENVAFTLWEAILHFPDTNYPIEVEGQTLTKIDLLFWATDILVAGGESIAKSSVGEDGVKQIRQQCIEAGFDPGS